MREINNAIDTGEINEITILSKVLEHCLATLDGMSASSRGTQNPFVVNNNFSQPLLPHNESTPDLATGNGTSDTPPDIFISPPSPFGFLGRAGTWHGRGNTNEHVNSNKNGIANQTNGNGASGSRDASRFFF